MCRGNMNAFNSGVRIAHAIVEEVVVLGDVAVDATAGNGHDTAFLCRRVGEPGHVYAFDTQTEAVERTGALLRERGLSSRATLIRAGHEVMQDFVDGEHHGRVAAVMFNLGYLPGGNKAIVTRPESTVAGIRQALGLLRPGGVVTLVLYTGHDGGREEANAVRGLVEQLDQREFVAIRWQTLNQKNDPPHLIAVKRRESA